MAYASVIHATREGLPARLAAHIDGRTRPKVTAPRKGLPDCQCLDSAGEPISLEAAGSAYRDAQAHLADLRKRAKASGAPGRKSAAHVLDVVIPLPVALDRVPEMARESTKWLQRVVGPGSRIAVSAVHYDEATPHFQALVVLGDTERRLGWSRIQRDTEGYLQKKYKARKGRTYYRAILTSFAKEVGAQFGLERGVPGSARTAPRSDDPALIEACRQRSEARERVAELEKQLRTEESRVAEASALLDRGRVRYTQLRSAALKMAVSLHSDRVVQPKALPSVAGFVAQWLQDAGLKFKGDRLAIPRTSPEVDPDRVWELPDGTNAPVVRPATAHREGLSPTRIAMPGAADKARAAADAAAAVLPPDSDTAHEAVAELAKASLLRDQLVAERGFWRDLAGLARRQVPERELAGFDRLLKRKGVEPVKAPDGTIELRRVPPQSSAPRPEPPVPRRESPAVVRVRVPSVGRGGGR